MTEAERHRRIQQNMGLVATIAADFRGGEIEFEDLLAIGRVGLVNGADSWRADGGAPLSAWLASEIRSEITHALRRKDSEWYPKEDDENYWPLDGDKIERIYEWGGWGERGNASGICERWTSLDATPEELVERYDELRDRRDKFSAAFMSLTSIQRQLVELVYLQEPQMAITGAAREIGISYWRAVRNMRKALDTMRNVISRMESNRQAA